ncbi:hypothetical protein ACU4GD_39245 [Cupriavidus basilensis]
MGLGGSSAGARADGHHRRARACAILTGIRRRQGRRPATERARAVEDAAPAACRIVVDSKLGMDLSAAAGRREAAPRIAAKLPSDPDGRKRRGGRRPRGPDAARRFRQGGLAGADARAGPPPDQRVASPRPEAS